MRAPKSEFVVSTEEECLTAVEGTDDRRTVSRATRRFLDVLRGLAPSVMCTSGGVFNPYGRVYRDTGGHVELAAIESACPYFLAEVTHRQHELVRRAVTIMAGEGCVFVLANNNHSGLLESGTGVWGAHENYLVSEHPKTFADRILPFLVSRVYGGAGGIDARGTYLAAVRPQFMELSVGGSTTERRAIHSTSREEHHMGGRDGSFRYHLILGDGHRSRFNLALQFGATALALKAVLFDTQLQRELERYHEPLFGNSWVKTIRELHVLARPGEEPRVHPFALELQRLYLAGARRYAESLGDDTPRWIPRLLVDWEQTLGAFELCDRGWLAARLDAFAKYEICSELLAATGCHWGELPGRKEVCYELALLQQNYHEFCNPQSVFSRAEDAGLLQHVVGESVTPGAEDEPYVPETPTRAQARARFIVENAGSPLVMDWSRVHDLPRRSRRLLSEPFARNYDPWTPSRVF